MQVLITGANGFVGRHLCRELQARGHGVSGALRAGWPRILAGVRYHEVSDLTEEVDWRPALSGIEAVVHCAALVHRRGGTGAANRAAMERLNVTATLALARQAAAAGVKRFCFMSSAGAGIAETKGTDRATPYQASKLLAERALRDLAEELGFDLVILRPPLVYGAGAPGNVARLERALSRGLPLPLASLDKRRAVLSVENLGDATALLLEHSRAAGGVYALSDGTPLSAPEFACLLAAAMGRTARLFPCPPALLDLGLRMAGLAGSRAALLEALSLDEAPLRQGLGWTPVYSTQEALARAYGAQTENPEPGG